MSTATAEMDPVALRLLDATISTIDEHGEVGVRVQDVVKDAGVQIPVLYRHFGNREGLVQAAQLERLRRDLDDEMSAVSEMLGGATTAEDFRSVFDAVLERICSPDRRLPRSRRVNVLGSTYGRPDLAAGVAAQQRVTIDRVAELLDRPASHGWLRDGLDTRVFATWFGGVMIGRIVADLDLESVDMDAYDQMWLDAVRHVLFG